MLLHSLYFPFLFLRSEIYENICCWGKSGSGKGEVAKMIEEYYIYKLKKSVVTEYSKYLKEFAKELTDWDGVSQNKTKRFLTSFGSTIRSYDKYFFY